MAVNTLDPLRRKAATKEAGDLPHGYFRVVRLSARIRSSATGFFTSVGAAIFPAPAQPPPSPGKAPAGDPRRFAAMTGMGISVTAKGYKLFVLCYLVRDGSGHRDR
jgi:hypothetical protein